MNTEGADSIPSTYRSVDWTTWLVWIAVCALEPLLWAVWNAAWNKTVLRADPNAGLIGGGIGATIVLTPLALPILEWLALRRIAPRLNIAVWYGTSQAARLLWVLLLFAAAAVGVRGGDVTTNYGPHSYSPITACAVRPCRSSNC